MKEKKHKIQIIAFVIAGIIVIIGLVALIKNNTSEKIEDNAAKFGVTVKDAGRDFNAKVKKISNDSIILILKNKSDCNEAQVTAR